MPTQKQFLDHTGLTELLDELGQYLKSKLNKLTVGDGVAIDNNDTIRTTGIPFGRCDSTSTATVFTATVPGIYKLEDGVCCMIDNGVVTSASGFTLNVNGLGAKPVYTNLAAATRDTTIFNINYTMLFVYDETRVSGGCWVCYRGYDANTNTIGYQLRTNSTVRNVSDTARYYKIYFTSADGTKWVPASVNSTNNATSARPVNQRPIDPFGRIVYTSANTNYAAGANLAATTIWDQYNLTLGYSFNRTGAALTLTAEASVYLKCAPLTDGSAIMDADTPIVLALPTTNDGKIYIFLGVATSATAIELVPHHPVYYHDGTGIRIWTGKDSYSKSEVDAALSGKLNNLTFDSTPTAGSTNPVTSGGIKAELDNKQDKPIELLTFFYNDLFEPRFPTSEENARVLTLQEQELWNKILNGITNKTDFIFVGHPVYFADPFNMDTATQHLWQVFFESEGTVETLTIHHSTTDDTELFWMNPLIPNDTYFVKNTQLRTINNQSLIGSGDISLDDYATKDYVFNVTADATLSSIGTTNPTLTLSFSNVLGDKTPSEIQTIMLEGKNVSVNLTIHLASPSSTFSVLLHLCVFLEACEFTGLVDITVFIIRLFGSIRLGANDEGESLPGWFITFTPFELRFKTVNGLSTQGDGNIETALPPLVVTITLTQGSASSDVSFQDAWYAYNTDHRTIYVIYKINYGTERVVATGTVQAAPLYRSTIAAYYGSTLEHCLVGLLSSGYVNNGNYYMLYLRWDESEINGALTYLYAGHGTLTLEAPEDFPSEKIEYKYDGTVDVSNVSDRTLANSIIIRSDLDTYADGAEYDSTNKLIYLKHGSTRLSNPIDATAFIKDGMVLNVTISTPSIGTNAGVKCIIITFNTDAGKEDIEIPVSLVFDSSLYYTKTETDTALSGKQATLVSGTNIKTINSTSLLGSGDISVQAPLTFDSTPTANSTNPVTSGGVATALTSYVTLSTSQNITGEKTFVGTKKIKFKKSTANDKLGFTLYDNTNKELCYLEYNTGDLCLGSYYQIPSSQVKSRAGFKMSDVSSGVNAVYRILTPYAADAKTPFSLTNATKDFYFPLGVSNGTTTLVTNSTGLLDISSFFNNYYTKTDTDTLLSGKQGTLVSGTDIKTVNNTSLLGSGNVDVTEFTELTAEEGLMLYSKMSGGTVDQTAFNAMCEKINAGLSVGKQIRGTITSGNMTFAIISVNGIRLSETSFMLVIYSTLWEYTRYSVSFEKENDNWSATRTEYISLNNHNIGENIRCEYDASFDGRIFSAVDEKVAQSASSENVDIPLLLASGATPGTAGAKYDTDFKFNPSTNTLKVGTGTLTATNYSGNAATATSDSLGNNISETYATKSEVEDNELVIARSLTELHDTKQELLTFDNTPTANSGNPVTSEGIKKALDGKQDKMVVMFRQVEGDTLSCDKSIADICTAVSAGTEVVGLIYESTSQTWASLRVSVASSTLCVFDIQYGEVYTNLIGSVVNGTDVWQREQSLNLVTDDQVVRWNSKQDALVSGTNIKTVNNNSLLGSGNVDLGGGDILYLGKGKYVLENAVDSSIDNALDDLDNAIHELGTPNEIARITATESQTSGGNNVVTITETNGTTTTFNVKNGIDGQDGVSLGEVALVQTTGDSEESVMSQKAVTEYGRKATAEDLNNIDDIKGISLPDGYVRLIYIDSGVAGSAAAIDTGLIPSDENWRFTGWWNAKGFTANWAPLFSAYSVESDNTYRIIRSSNSDTAVYVGAYQRASAGNTINGFVLNKWFGFDLQRGTVKWMNGNVSALGTTTGSICNATMKIGHVKTSALFKEFKAYHNEELVSHMIPCKYGTSVGMYDIVREQFFTSSNENPWLGGDIHASHKNISGSALASLITQELGESDIKIVSQQAIKKAISYDVKETGTALITGKGTSYEINTWLKLTDKQVEVLNNTDIISFYVVARDGIKNNTIGTNFVYSIINLVGGASVSWDVSGRMRANSIGYGTNDNIFNAAPNTVTPLWYPDVWIVVLDRVNGIAKFYDKTTLKRTIEHDSLKTQSFVTERHLFRISSGNNQVAWFDIAVFDYDITQLFSIERVGLVKELQDAQGWQPINGLIDRHFQSDIAGQWYNYGGSMESDIYGSGTGWTVVNANKSDDGYRHATNSTTTNSLNIGYYIGGDEAELWEADVEVLSGIVSFSTGAGGIIHVIDTNGDEVDRTQVSVGEYTLKGVAAFHGKWSVSRISGDVHVVYKQRRYKLITCPIHLKCNALYDGRVYDDQAEIFYPKEEEIKADISGLYYANTAADMRLVNKPLHTLRYNVNGIPHYDGETAIVGNKVYIGMPDYTWKQINNS